jgi:hypothetical protein
LTHAQRLAIVDFRNTTIGPKPMIVALQKDAGYPALLAFVAGAQAQPAGRLPQVHSWERHRSAADVPARRMATFAQRRGTAGLLAVNLCWTRGGSRRALSKTSSKQVNNADFCRDQAGRWNLESRTVYMSPVVDRAVEGSGAGSSSR